MSGFKITVTGLDDLKKQLDPAELKRRVQDEFVAFGLDVVRDAKQLAATDEGLLKNSIGSVSVEGGVEITVGVDYASYVEFGTRSFAATYISTLPAEWEVFAAQFKGGGGGGTFEEMVRRITAWVHRKGITGTYSVKTKKRTGGKATVANQDKQVAYAIALKILRVGIKPQPFLYPAIEKNRLELIKRFKYPAVQ